MSLVCVACKSTLGPMLRLSEAATRCKCAAGVRIGGLLAAVSLVHVACKSTLGPVLRLSVLLKQPQGASVQRGCASACHWRQCHSYASLASQHFSTIQVVSRIARSCTLGVGWAAWAPLDLRGVSRMLRMARSFYTVCLRYYIFNTVGCSASTSRTGWPSCGIHWRTIALASSCASLT